MSVRNELPFRLRRTAALGVHSVAARQLHPGELVLLEAPLVSTNTSVAPGLPSTSVEWMLTHAVLTLVPGRAAEWASAYCSDIATRNTPADEATDAWLCQQQRCSVADVATVHAAVRCNAFGLESPLLGVEYGAAFYETACRFNHSCQPNCVSIRIGGNMAIFTAARVGTGTELRHSYLPSRLLITPRATRAAHLHFACGCPRCVDESSEPPPRSRRPAADSSAALLASACDALGAQAMARVQLAMASDDEATMLEEGARLLSQPAVVSALEHAPLAAIEVCAPLLAAHHAAVLRRTSQGDGGGGGGGGGDGGGGGAGQARPRDEAVHERVRYAARLQALSAERIREHYAGSGGAARLGGHAAAAHLFDCALLAWRLLEAPLSPPRDATTAGPREGACHPNLSGEARPRGHLALRVADEPKASPPGGGAGGSVPPRP